MKRWLPMVVLACSVVMLASCQTLNKAVKGGEPSAEAAPEAEAAPPAPTEFTPVAPTATLQRESGAYPTLFAPSSTATWVDANVVQQLRDAYTAKGGTVDPLLDATADVVANNLIVIQVHVESAMPDSSVAYDAVRFQNIDCYLLSPNAEPVHPIQIIIGTPVEESQQGTLKRFGRTNILVFPRFDPMVGGPIVPAEASAVRLALDGYGCIFYFEWPNIVPGATTASPPSRIAVIQGNFEEFFGKLVDAAHIFD